MTRPASRLLVLALAVGSTGFTVLRDPGGTGPIRWATSSITARVHQAGSADIDDGSDLEAVRAAFAAWSSVSGSDLILVDGGTSSNRIGSCDGDGVVTVSVFESWSYSSGVVAFTDHCRTGATITDGEVLVNGEDFTWATDGDPKKYDLQSTVTHELGHVVGLHHGSHPSATMFCCGGKGLTYARTLHTEDELAVRYLYPSGAFSCSDDLECPLLAPVYGPSDGTAGGGIRLACSAGSCAAGDAPYGGDCYLNSECTSGACARISGDVTNGDDPGFCTQSCGSCPGGDLCSGGNCLVGRDDCVAVRQDAPCTGSNVVCTRDLDGRYRCNRLCYLPSHCAAVADSTCWGGISDQDAGFCLVPGATTTGDCEGPFDCESLLCTSNAAGAEVCAGESAPGDGGPPGGDSVIPPGGDSASPPGGDSASPPGGDSRSVLGDSAVGGGDMSRIGGDGSVATSAPIQPIESGCACQGGGTNPVFILLGFLPCWQWRRRSISRHR